jgi:hypothetical protein
VNITLKATLLMQRFGFQVAKMLVALTAPKNLISLAKTSAGALVDPARVSDAGRWNAASLVAGEQASRSELYDRHGFVV